MHARSAIHNITSSKGELQHSRSTNQNAIHPQIVTRFTIVNGSADSVKKNYSKDCISNRKENIIKAKIGKEAIAKQHIKLKVKGEMTAGGKGSSSFKGNVYNNKAFFLMKKEEGKRLEHNVTPRRLDNTVEMSNSRNAISKITDNSFTLTNLSISKRSPRDLSAKTKANLAKVFRQPKLGFSPKTIPSAIIRPKSVDVVKNHSAHNKLNDSTQTVNKPKIHISLPAKVRTKSGMGANLVLFPKSSTPNQGSRDLSENRKNLYTVSSSPKPVSSARESQNRLSPNKSPFNKLQTNQKSGLKSKALSPVMFYVKRIPSAKPPKCAFVKVKTKPNNVITSVLPNNNQSMNLSPDASTNSISKIENKENGISNTTDKEKTPNVPNFSSREEKQERNEKEKVKNIEFITQIHVKYKENDEGPTEMNSTRVNKYSDKKGEVDFRQITTSPIVRKNEEIKKQEGNPASSVNKNLVSAVANERTAPAISMILERNHHASAMSNTSSVVKKNIKLLHEFTKIGYGGEGIKKVNQDNYFIFNNFVGNPNHIFIGVCDGHGMIGHEVSNFIKENLPLSLNNALKSKNKNILLNPIHGIIEDAFIDTNLKLISNEMIDSTFSGSTCVSLIYTSEKLICANVGDSRAVLGQYSNGEWVSYNLSRDHKPVELDEASRILQKGGRIEPFRDDNNEFIGPPRIWLKDDEIPGLAMTRSFGDRVAATVGVISEPEITVYQFTEGDKFVILASDGIWEFIESNECVNIMKDYYLKNDIVGCCEELHREASIRWMKEEEVIDDITMIVIFLE